MYLFRSLVAIDMFVFCSTNIYFFLSFSSFYNILEGKESFPVLGKKKKKTTPIFGWISRFKFKS